MVALSALENGVIKPLDTFRCKGKIVLYGEKFHCWEKDGHGIVNLRKGIQRSCDVYFYEVARKLGVDRLSETAKKFGLGKKHWTASLRKEQALFPILNGRRSSLDKIGTLERRCTLELVRVIFKVHLYNYV